MNRLQCDIMFRAHEQVDVYIVAGNVRLKRLTLNEVIVKNICCWQEVMGWLTGWV